jgi:hypothetical protein
MKLPVSFPLLMITPGQQPGLTFTDLRSSIRFNIEMTLLTNPGEIPWAPDFGSPLNGLKYRRHIPLNQPQLSDQIGRILQAAESRISQVSCKIYQRVGLQDEVYPEVEILAIHYTITQLRMQDLFEVNLTAVYDTGELT